MKKDTRWLKLTCLVFALILIINIAYLKFTDVNNRALPSASPNLVTTKLNSDYIPEIVYYTSHRRAKGNHTTTFYRYSPESQIQKIILSIPTTPDRILSRAVLSPDKTKIAYSIYEQTTISTEEAVRTRELWLVNADGTNNELMSSHNAFGPYITDEIIWSPNNQEIIYYTNYTAPHRIDLDTKQILSMPNLPEVIEGWFENNTFGYTIANPTGCPPGYECYPSYNAVTTNTDGLQLETVYTAPKNFVPTTRFSWRNDGSGLFVMDNRGLSHVDFKSSEINQVIRFPDTVRGDVSSVVQLPLSRKVLASVYISSYPALYTVDLESNDSSEIKKFDSELGVGSIASVSKDEKYVLMDFKKISLEGTTNRLEVHDTKGNLIDAVPYTYTSVVGFVE